MSNPNRTGYDGVAMALHWLTALLVIFMLVFGEELMGAGESAEEAGGTSEALAGTFLPSIHVSVGVSILALTLLRLVWRLTHPATASHNQEILGSYSFKADAYCILRASDRHSSHGWLAFGDFLREEPAMAAVRVFGLFPLPAGPVIGEIAKELHEIGSNLMIALVVLHVLAALKHQFLDDDGVFRRMLPY